MKAEGCKSINNGGPHIPLASEAICTSVEWSAHKIDDPEIADVNLDEYVCYYKQDQGIEGYSIVKCQS